MKKFLRLIFVSALVAAVFSFSPVPGVKAEGIVYTTQLGVRVPAIFYLADPLPPKNILA